MKHIVFFFILLLCCSCHKKSNEQAAAMNVVIIYADDLGFGDVSAYDVGTLATPNFDAIAHGGICFTRGYATAATCTPSRYSLLTGEYPWRNRDARVLSGNAPLIIDEKKDNLAKLFQRAGYRTAVIGKWHLGLGGGQVDWNTKINKNPNDIGFDESFIMAATNDRTPTVYIENGYVAGLEADDPLYVKYGEAFEGEPTGKENRELLRLFPSHKGHDDAVHNGIGRIGFQKGGKAALWVDEDMADTFLVRSQDFIRRNRACPFFLFYALHQPHAPRIPHGRFAGRTGLGARGDAIAEADWCVGELIKTLQEEGLYENTLIIFSSDNGPVLDDGYEDQSEELLGDHRPGGVFRGGKYSLYDAGTHVPLMVMWPEKIKPGQWSDALISQVDLYASLAELLGQPCAKEIDSENHLKALLGQSDKGRESMVVEGLQNRLAYRSGDWVLIPPYAGSYKVPWGVDIETGFSKEYQLYNLKDDPAQKNNLAKEMPDRVQKMQKEFDQVKSLY